jgi:hypothetical protein
MVLNLLIAVPVFGLIRRVVRPVLLTQPGDRRRRAEPSATGPLGLRGLEV